MALVQGVQEGGEMNGAPLPHGEQQQFVRLSSENTDEFGSFSIPPGDAAGKRLT